MGRMQQRVDDYPNAGLPHVWWLIHRRVAFVGKPGTINEVKEAVLRTAGPEIILPPAEPRR